MHPPPKLTAAVSSSKVYFSWLQNSPCEAVHLNEDYYARFVQIASERDPDGKFANAFTRLLFNVAAQHKLAHS